MLVSKISPSCAPKVHCARHCQPMLLSQTRTNSPVKCRSCASDLLPVSAKMSDACIPWRSSTVCVSNTFLPPRVVAPAVAGSACATAEREMWRRAAERSDEEGLTEEGEVERRGARASWRRRSVEAILVAAGSSVVVVVFDVVGGKRTVLIRRRRRRCRRKVTPTIP